MRKNILFITGTRADYGLLKPVIKQMFQSPKMKPKVLATGIHALKKFGLTLGEIKKDKMPIVAIVKISEKDSMIQSLSKEISGIADYCASDKIDYIVVLGDRDEAFAGAVVGLHLNIPVIHFSGGDVSGPSVDHYLRNAITVFSKFHFVQTIQSRKNAIKLGTDPKFTFVAGSLGLNGLQPNQMPDKEAVAKKMLLDKNKKWFLVSMHPTLFDNIPTRGQIDPLIDFLKTLDGEKIIIYPNSDTGAAYFIKKINSISKKPDVHIYPNLAMGDYLCLMKNCDIFIGNSSSGLTEAGFMKTPFVNIGNRQKGREAGANVIFCDYDQASIKKGINLALSDKFRTKLQKTKSIYTGGEVAKRVVSILESRI